MLKLFSSILFLSLPVLNFAVESLSAPSISPSMSSYDEPKHLIVNNRILAKVNGKTISVVDVMKKMDVFLNRAYPQYAESKSARYQFYTAQWRNTLTQMIDNELILADAESIELKVNDSDVRETLQERFGPNVMANLEKIGITYEEARDMIHAEIVVQRMNWFRINSKALLSVNPQDIKVAYKEYCEKNPPADDWKYQVLSIRGSENTALTPLNERIQSMLSTAESSLQAVYDKISSEENPDPAVTLTLSPLYEVNDKSLSASHRQTLASLTPGSMSTPIIQTSRDGSIVSRIFYLIEHVKKQPPPFDKIYEQLFEKLAEAAAGKESTQYISRLRQKISFEEKHFQETLPADFQPFVLK